jgi:hypothetical protein
LSALILQVLCLTNASFAAIATKNCKNHSRENKDKWKNSIFDEVLKWMKAMGCGETQIENGA